MTTFAFPSQVPAEQEWGLRSNTQSFSSPLTGSTQTVEMPGAAWTCQMTFKNLTRDQMRIFSAFLVRLRGQANRAHVPNHAARAPMGIATGTPIVSGASQTGTTLITAGWTASKTGILLAGDYIVVGNRMKMVVADANSDGSGNSTLTIEPPIGPGMAPTNGSSITVSSPTCIMMLDNATVKWATQPGLFANFSIGWIEDVIA